MIFVFQNSYFRAPIKRYKKKNNNNKKENFILSESKYELCFGINWKLKQLFSF